MRSCYRRMSKAVRRPVQRPRGTLAHLNREVAPSAPSSSESRRLGTLCPSPLTTEKLTCCPGKGQASTQPESTAHNGP